ncbi:MAG: DNA adenine methylase, partial [Boseongicola sp. SB0667_bin_21]|nr:DNA adenine methylase [Boseongicola sp. SB0667_bin_21]
MVMVTEESKFTMSEVEPAEPIATYFGGKRLLAKRIIERIEAIPHDCYAEPFVGMGVVFLRRGKRPRCEILNDLNQDIVNLFRVVREHPDELNRQFEYMLSSRSEFFRITKIPLETMTDVQRAARYAYLQVHRFSGIPTTNSINTSSLDKAKFDPKRMRSRIDRVYRRLQGVRVECEDWSRFIERYDKPHTLFYLDPPYWGHEDDYGKGLFKREDFAR